MAEDRRVRRTRSALHEALLDLMAEKGFEAVTVQDLIDRADVGRSTFYAHFRDKSDLLQDVLSQLGAMIGRPPPGGRPDRRRPLRFGLPMLNHVQDQRALLRAMLARPGAGVVRAELERTLTRVVRAELDALATVSASPRIPLDLIAAGVVASFMAVLTWWVGQGFQQTPEELEAAFLTLAGPGVRAALPPPVDPVDGRYLAAEAHHRMPFSGVGG